jgi:hypothetical protein
MMRQSIEGERIEGELTDAQRDARCATTSPTQVWHAVSDCVSDPWNMTRDMPHMQGAACFSSVSRFYTDASRLSYLVMKMMDAMEEGPALLVPAPRAPDGGACCQHRLQLSHSPSDGS